MCERYLCVCALHLRVCALSRCVHSIGTVRRTDCAEYQSVAWHWSVRLRHQCTDKLERYGSCHRTPRPDWMADGRGSSGLCKHLPYRKVEFRVDISSQQLLSVCQGGSEYSAAAAFRSAICICTVSRLHNHSRHHAERSTAAAQGRATRRLWPSDGLHDGHVVVAHNHHMLSRDECPLSLIVRARLARDDHMLRVLLLRQAPLLERVPHRF